MTLYTVGGVDLSDFANSWLPSLERDDAPARSLLDHIEEGYDYGAHFMMANIGPQAVDPSAGKEVLLLYAVLAVFQNDEFPGCREGWQGTAKHLERAFKHAKRLGDRGLAKTLLRELADRSKRDRAPMFEDMLAQSMGHAPARIAAHDRNMANILSRDVRAAKLLDPSASVDDFLLE
ncbi:hypothetical protein [Amycolatopsis anabasis]|uniref:hypothetical protein n=1 Tax=Amycolatopsis anabasis TaxID=1840409 RepID=UPI00131DD55F|nr:hypothetical protein [Amycolatopsis anabasis]